MARTIPGRGPDGQPIRDPDTDNGGFPGDQRIPGGD